MPSKKPPTTSAVPRLRSSLRVVNARMTAIIGGNVLYHLGSTLVTDSAASTPNDVRKRKKTRPIEYLTEWLIRLTSLARYFN